MADQASDDRWLVITVEAPSDALKEVIAEGLLALGGTAVQESDQEVSTYVRVPTDIPAWIDEAAAGLREVSGADSLRIDWRVQESEDWTQLWKRGLGPRRVGRRFVVTPSWTKSAAPSDDLTIVVDPEMAFGTGEHATTRAALRFLEQTVQPGDRILDVGTGSAILAIGAAKLGASSVTAVDNDADALVNARDNVQRNHVASAVTLEQQSVDAQYLTTARGLDVIVANVLSSVLVPLLPAFWSAVRKGGYVILGGILEEEADDVLAASEAAGFQVITEDLEEEWWCVLLRRPPQAEN